MLGQLIVWTATFLTCVNANVVNASQTTPSENEVNITMTSFTHGNISAGERPIPMRDERISASTLPPSISWTFLVKLVSLDNNLKVLHCGGVVYNESYVLTTANCVYNVKPHLVNVTAGNPSTKGTQGREQIRTVLKVIEHPECGIFMDHAFALLQLSSPLDLTTPYVTPIEINVDHSCPAPNDNCSSAGWGKLVADGDHPEFPSQFLLPVISNNDCMKIDDVKFSRFTRRFHLCAGDVRSGQSICRADPGGPLVCTCGGTTKLAGVVSLKKECANPWYTARFIRISCYVQWIQTGKANYPCGYGICNFFPPIGNQPFIAPVRSRCSLLSLGNSLALLCILSWCVPFLFT